MTFMLEYSAIFIAKYKITNSLMVSLRYFFFNLELWLFSIKIKHIFGIGITWKWFRGFNEKK